MPAETLTLYLVRSDLDTASMAVLRTTESLMPIFVDAGLGVHLVAPRPSQLRNSNLDEIRRKIGMTKVPALSFGPQLLAEGATQVISELEKIAGRCEDVIHNKRKSEMQNKPTYWDGGPEGDARGGYHEWARGRIGQPNKREDRDDRMGGEAMDENEIRNKMRDFQNRRKGRSAPPSRRRSRLHVSSRSTDDDSEPEEPRRGHRRKKTRRGLSVAPPEENGGDVLSSIKRSSHELDGDDKWMTQRLFDNQLTTTGA